MHLIGFVILFLAFLGYGSLFNKKFDIKVEFTPFLIVSAITISMLLAGLAGLLLPFSYVIVSGGIISLLYILISKKTFKIFNSKKGYFIFLIWFLAVAYFAALHKGVQFVQYDNFTHWALAVKYMLIENRLINANDIVIFHPTYPLGSSVFIYFICQFIGKTESCQIIGQIFSLIAFLLTLTVFIKKKNLILGSFILFLFAIFALSANICILDLSVDTLITLAALGLFCYIESNPVNENNLNKFLLVMVPLQVMLLYLKSSGIFFFIVCAIYLLFKLTKTEIYKKAKKTLFLKLCTINLAIPAFFVYLWNIHVKYSFLNSELSRHAISVSKFQENINLKTPDDILMLIGKMIDTLSNIYNSTYVIMTFVALLMLVPMIYYFLVKKNKISLDYTKKLIGIYVVFAAYVFCLFLTYVFSMPVGELHNFYSFDRYMLTAVVFLLGVAIVYLLKDRFFQKNKLIGILLILIMANMLFSFKDNFDALYKKQDFKSKSRYELLSLLNQTNRSSSGKYLVYMTKSQILSKYFLYILKYELLTDQFYVFEKDTIDTCNPKLKEFDYIISFVSDEKINEWLKEKGLIKYAKNEPFVIDLKNINQ